MDERKIGTFTFHVAHNYGAMLQAYALPVAIKRLGYQCEVIDYRFPHIYRWGKVDSYNEMIIKYGFVGAILRRIKRHIKGMYSPRLKINKFNYFRENVITHSEQIYSCKEELVELDYDFIIFGSDQIWNEQLTGGVASEFFGDFPILEKTKKIAYAASNGRSEFPRELKEKYHSYLASFSALGIREKGLTDTLNKDNFNATTVLDPTLLLSSVEWDEMINKTRRYIDIPKEEYMLIYAFDEKKELYEMAKKIASENGVKIVIISYERKEEYRDSLVFEQCGPAEFVELIKNAKIVLTTSFHGTVFSIIYHREFYCVPHPKFSERTDSLLSLLGLENRNIIDYKVENKANIIWKNVDARLAEEKIKSIEFIKGAIEC